MSEGVVVTLGGSRELSPMQRGLWASQLATPDAPVQNMVLVSHIDGPVDSGRLAAAFRTVVEASDVLRTRLDRSTGAVQLIPPAEVPGSEIIQLERDEVEAWARRRAQTTLDMAQGGYDSAIAEHADGTVSWYLNLHHVITDATSSALVFDATAEAYAGTVPDLDSYYRWARRLAGPGTGEPDALAQKRTRRAQEHWRGRPAAPKISGLYRPIDEGAPDAERLPLELGADLVARTEARLADDYRMLTEDLAWTSLLVTATAIYCHRLSGASTFSIGLPVHNRSDLDARSLVGPTVEVFPVDVTIEPGDTHRTLHKRLSRAILTTMRHASPGTSPAADYQVVVNAIARAEQQQFGSWPTTTKWIDTGAIDASHLLRVQMTSYVDPGVGAGGHEFALDINNATAPPGQRARAAGHYLAVLSGLVDDPDMAIATTSLCGTDELTELARWEQGPEPALPAPLVVDRLRSSLSGRGDVVIEEGGTALGGEDLWGWIETTAGWLQAQGVGRGTRVGIELPRSLEAVVAIMATLVAGGSFVPLDPAQPEARRRQLASRAGCLVTIDGDSDLADLRTAGGHRPVAVDVQPADEAYLLFTSGSTGQPKGVPISHGGLAGYVQFAVDRYVSHDRPVVAPLFSALTFDLTVTTLFVPILAGGSLIVIPDDGPTALTAIAARTDITWCKATPSHLRLLVRMLPADHELATLIVGGEAFGTRLATELLGVNPEMAIHNEYGPTEAVVGCMEYLVEPDLLASQSEVPIGRPAPGVTLLTLDRHLQRVPIGASGELYIAHDGLTAGYLDADGTETPFVEIDGRRFYRSGDLVRLQDTERMVYLGRVDEQVKVGGIRLEPVEVEAALESHPLVERAAVRLWSPSATAPGRHCIRCGLPDNVPGIDFDDAGVCSTCHSFDRVAPVAESWFRTPDDLSAKLEQVRSRATGDYDCLHLLSGGKDSTYALYRLVELGFRPYALTLDNGFISDGAKENVRRSVADLQIDHEFATSDAMNDIFRDSLERFSNVCHGCYKTIYTLATTRAVELGIPLIITGLSRGQLFETRLVPQQFSIDRFDPDAIDRAVLEARKTYHRIDDGPNRLLDTEVFADDAVFEQVEYLDFYRYVDVELADMLSFLTTRAPWVRPADTGRSTNCLINAAGIHTHQTERGFHNYAEPYAWDVRLGHKTRTEAIEELDDQLDLGDVAQMLREVGYEPSPRRVLTAWVELAGSADEMPTPTEFRAFLGQRLPTHAIPSAFMAVDALPLTTNGKLDEAALPAPRRVHRPSSELALAPTTELERTIVDLWERVLHVEPISVDDDFFALGGDSLAALGMIVALAEARGEHLGEELAFVHTTPRALAAAVELAGRGTVPPRQRPADLDLDSFATPDGQPPTPSAGELAILFDQAERPDQVMYNIARSYRVHGPVDAARFEAALRTVSSRHQPLSWGYGAPRTRLAPDEAVRFEAMSTPVALEELERVARTLHVDPYDLEAGPLVRALVQPIADGTTAVVLGIHHVSGDAESIDRLWRQVDDELSGRVAELPSIDYAGFSAWQRANQPVATRDHWVESSGVEPAARLAIHAPAVAGPDGYLTRRCAITVDQLRLASRSSRFAMVLAAVAAVVRRHSDGPEVELGMITSTRDHPDAEPLVGYFLNTVPVRLHMAELETIADLIDASAAAVGGALAHRAHPQAQIRADRRTEGRPEPVTDVLVVLEDLADVALEGRVVEQEVFWSGSAVADLTFFVALGDADVTLGVEYRGSAVDGVTAERLLTALDRALTLAVTDASAPLDVSLAELAGDSLVVGAPLADDTLVIDRLARHIEQQPHQPAVVCGADRMDWGTLGERAHAIAGLLRAAAVGPGDRVVVCLPRSTDLVAAIIGVHLAGASYVPVDPTYPDERIRLIVAASGAAVGIVGSDAVAGLLDRPIRLEDGPDRPSPADPAAPARVVAADDEAYLIFTSGSTGRPRGVPVRHRHLAASTNARAQFYDDTPDQFLMVSSPAFDSSIVGLFWTLAEGGTVLLPTEREVHDIDALGELARRGSVTHTLMVPSLHQALLSREAGVDAGAGWAAHVIVAGEACLPSLVDEHFAVLPGVALTNEYGPTEATVWATAHRCAPGETVVPVGTPIAGAWVAVVDTAGRPLPPGVEGELVIGGHGVVDGYLDDPAATASKFGVMQAALANGRADGQRCFHTGDRAVLIDGTFHFLGRVDNQLNVGGARVEPEEIEAVLVGFDGVESAIVTAIDTRAVPDLLEQLPAEVVGRAMKEAADRPDPAAALVGLLRASGSADRRLVAHVEAAEALDLETLRRHVAGALPRPQQPSLYVRHDALPRTPNGKLDREGAVGLALPDVSPIATAATAADPASGGHAALTTSVTDLFRQVLRSSDVGPHDSFFDHGGQSLLAMELLLVLEEQLGRRLSTGVLYDHPTPALLAAAIGKGRSPDEPSRSFLVPIQPEGSLPPVFAVHVLGVDCEFFRPLAARLGDDQPFYGLGQPTKTPDADAPADISEIAAVYVEEIERVAPTGPVSLTAISLGGTVAFELAQQLTARGRRVGLLTLFESAGPGGAIRSVPVTTRLALHARLLRRDGWGYLSGRLDWQHKRVQRLSQRAQLKLQDKLHLQPNQELRIRQFIEANIETQVAYRFEPYLSPMLLLRAADEPFADEMYDESFGWSDVAVGPVRIETVPGGHISMTAEPHVERVAAIMSEELERAYGATDAPLVDRTQVEAALAAGLRKGTLASVMANLERRSDLSADGAALLSECDRIAVELAKTTETLAESVEDALGAAGLRARLRPVPRRMQHSAATVALAGDIERATEVMAGLGFEVDEGIGQAARKAMVEGTGRIDYIRRGAATTRIRLDWGDEHQQDPSGFVSRLNRTFQPSRADFLAAQLPAWAWRAYWPLRPARVARDRLRDRFARGRVEGADLGLFLGTPPGLIAPLLRFASARADELVVDIGCGDARVLIEAARTFGCRGRGYEIDEKLAERARHAVTAAGLDDRIEIIAADAAGADLSDVDLVFAFLPPESVAALLPSTLERLAPGSRLLTHEQLGHAWPKAPDQTRLLVSAPGADPADGGMTLANLWFGVRPRV